METVRSWMSSPAITVGPAITVPAARELMQRHQIRRLPVVDDAGRLIGMLTDRDVRRVSARRETDVREYDLYHRARDLPIGEIMSQPPISVAPDTPILTAAQILLDRRIGGVPVVEGGQVVGVITESDMFRLIVRREFEAAFQSVRG